MKTYRTNDGLTLNCETPKGLLEALREKSDTPSDDLQAFEEALARRVHQQTGAVIDTASATSIVEGLLASGLVTEISGEA